MNTFRENLIIALLVAVLLLQIFNMNSSLREGFQTTTQQTGPKTSSFSYDPADIEATPNTCAIINAVREQVVKALNKATLEQDENIMNQMADSLKSLDAKITEMKC
jgi:hypothetical protein